VRVYIVSENVWEKPNNTLVFVLVFFRIYRWNLLYFKRGKKKKREGEVVRKRDEKRTGCYPLFKGIVCVL
jgi:hypothetical protein